MSTRSAAPLERSESTKKSKSKERIVRARRVGNGSQLEGELRKSSSSSSGLVRSKPSREIYRPPSFRKDRRSACDSAARAQNSNLDQTPSNKQTSQQINRKLNVNAEEFKYPSPAPGGQQAFYRNMTAQQGLYYGGDSGYNNGGYFPLQQSKSSGNVQTYFNSWNQNQQGDYVANHYGNRPPPVEPSYSYGLKQSKSSGNIISSDPSLLNGTPKPGKNVRFDFSTVSSPSEQLREHVQAAMVPESRFSKMRKDLDSAQESFATLNLNGEPNSIDRFPNGQNSQYMNQLQKSVSSYFVPKSYNNMEISSNGDTASTAAAPKTTLRRSNSFIPKSSTRQHPMVQLPMYLIANIDLDMKRWTANIQEFVTKMIATGENEESSVDFRGFNNNNNNVDTGLLPSAINIFLYFIQREKDRTVMETVVNTCFATYQKLHKESLDYSDPDFKLPDLDIKTVELRTRWSILLHLVTSLYSRVKVIRTQHSQNPGYQALDELKTSMMSLLCNSCLATLQVQSLQSPEIMDLLFTIMTSVGRDMELCHAGKMKQILASVRDVLLGIKPYGGPNQSTSPGVQKTLMQLIELHAANWHLPASAVRYYYYQPA